jgi:hypothetical protein
VLEARPGDAPPAAAQATHAAQTADIERAERREERDR